METFDINRVHWEIGKFEPWYIAQDPTNLQELHLDEDEELIVIELAGKRFGFMLREVIYHHIIQGKLNGVDFILTFCGVCNAGVILSPMVNNKLHHFRETGVYNGQQIFEDTETNSIWNHLTGEALHGKLKGKTLDFIGSLMMTTFGEEINENPRLPIYISGKKKFYRSLMRLIIKVVLGKRNKNWLPPHFQKTLPKVDASLPKMTMGLAVMINKKLRFYPMEAIKTNGITDTLNGTALNISIDNKIPRAKDDAGNYPFQLFTRWYAFILTYPNGELYKP